MLILDSFAFSQEAAKSFKNPSFYFSTYLNPEAVHPIWIDYSDKFPVVNGVGFKFFKDLKKGGKLVIGQSYFNFFRVFNNNFPKEDCQNYSHFIQIDIRNRYLINSFNLLFGFQFKPLNKKKTFTLQLLNHYGVNFQHNKSVSNVGYYCYRNYDSNARYFYAGYQGEIVFSNIIFSNSKRVLLLNYGGIGQVSRGYFQACIKIGIEVKFSEFNGNGHAKK